MGIAELALVQARGIPIEDVLDGLTEKDRDILETALLTRNPTNRREHLVSVADIIRACAADGYTEVTEWSIKNWRRKHGNR